MTLDRLKKMLDEETEHEFLELSPLCGMAMEYGDVPRAGLISGKIRCSVQRVICMRKNISMLHYDIMGDHK